MVRTIEEAIIDWLSENEIIKSFILVDGRMKIYPSGDIPEGASLPWVTYDRVDASRPQVLSGSVDVEESRVKMTITSESPSEAREISGAIKMRMMHSAFVGVIAGVNVLSLRLSQDVDAAPIAPSYDEETGLFGVVQEYAIWHRVAAYA